MLKMNEIDACNSVQHMANQALTAIKL